MSLKPKIIPRCFLDDDTILKLNMPKRITRSPTISGQDIPLKRPKIDNITNRNNDYNDVTPSNKNQKENTNTNSTKNDFDDITSAEARMKIIQNLMLESTNYAKFLEKKLLNCEVTTTATRKGKIGILQKLKYFVGGKLMPHQLDGVAWLILLFENGLNGILADEMGLGKTIQIIALLSFLYENNVTGPYLIVIPLSTLGNWLSEFKRFAPKLPVVRFHGMKIEKIEQMRIIESNYKLNGKLVKPVVICTYQVPVYYYKFLNKFTWQYIIVDEGHRVKNSSSQLSQKLRSLKSVNRLLLTGTPIQNDLKELWSLLSFVMPDLFVKVELENVLELEDMKDKDKILEAESRTKLISSIQKIIKPFILRREKKDVFEDFIPKKEVIIYCGLTELQKYIYKLLLDKDFAGLNMKDPRLKTLDINAPRQVRQCRSKNPIYNFDHSFELFDTLANSQTGVAPLPKNETDFSYSTPEHVPVKCPKTKYINKLNINNIMMSLRQAVNHPYLLWFPIDPKSDDKNPSLLVNKDIIMHSGKLMVLDALLPKLKADKHKVLIFSTSVMFMDIIEEYLLMRYYKYRKLDGRDSFETRTERINDFSNQKDIFIFLLSTRAGGLGLNLTAADTVIFMDRDWNPMADLQAQDRCHRIGQTKPVMIYSLITKGTIDEVILNRGEWKTRLKNVILEKGRFKNMSKQTIDEQALKELLDSEEQLTSIHANGLMYTVKELDEILDRSDLLKQYKK